MATVNDMLLAIKEQIDTAFKDFYLKGDPVTVTCGKGWFPVKVIQDTVRGSKALIAVVNRPPSKNVTRWMAHDVEEEEHECGIESTLSSDIITTGESGSLTIDYADGSSTVNLYDSISFVVKNPVAFGQGSGFVDNYAAVTKAAAGETLATLASKLADAINEEAPLNEWVQASAAGNVLTVENLTDTYLELSSHVGNRSTIRREIGRRINTVQLACFTASPAIRDAIGDKLDELTTSWEADFGLIANNDPVRIMVTGDMEFYDDALKEILRRDFMLEVERPIMSTDETFTVIATQGTKENL